MTRSKPSVPSSVGIVTGAGAEMVWDLLIAKKRGEEQEKLFVELQVAYDKIRSHERKLQSGKEALEKANEELESRLAEIFFTHEFFKALTTFSSVEDVTSLIVDGANGILGAEISAVYLFAPEDWTLRLCASQGRPEDDVPPGGARLRDHHRCGVPGRVRPAERRAAWFRAR